MSTPLVIGFFNVLNNCLLEFWSHDVLLTRRKNSMYSFITLISKDPILPANFFYTDRKGGGFGSV